MVFLYSSTENNVFTKTVGVAEILGKISHRNNWFLGWPRNRLAWSGVWYPWNRAGGRRCWSGWSVFCPARGNSPQTSRSTRASTGPTKTDKTRASWYVKTGSRRGELPASKSRSFLGSAFFGFPPKFDISEIYCMYLRQKTSEAHLRGGSRWRTQLKRNLNPILKHSAEFSSNPLGIFFYTSAFCKNANARTDW